MSAFKSAVTVNNIVYTKPALKYECKCYVSHLNDSSCS